VSDWHLKIIKIHCAFREHEGDATVANYVGCCVLRYLCSTGKLVDFYYINYEI